MALTTTAERVTHDLQRSLVKNALEVAQVCPAPLPEYTATLAVSLHEPATFDAAIWKAAEFLCRQRYPHYADQRLIGLPARIQAECYQHAAQAFHVARCVLEGRYTRVEVEQAAADFYSHVYQLAQARVEAAASNVVPFRGGCDGAA